MGRTKEIGMRMAGVAVVALIVGALIAWLMVDQAISAPKVGGEAGERPALFLGNELLPPMNFMERGKPAGIVVDLAKAVAKRMHRPVEIQLMNWTEAQQLVLDGRADALLQINPNPERLKIYDFSAPLLNTEFTIFTAAERLGIASISDLHGLKVGVEEKGLPILLLQGAPQIIVEIIPDLVQGFRMLAAGALDAMVADRWVGSYVLAENHIRGVKLIQEPIARSHSAIAVKKGNTDLLGDINAALADIRRDGTYERIIKSWRSKEVVFKTREQLRQQAWLITVILVALIVALLSIAALVMEIRRRKRGETTLRESEARLDLALRSAHMGVWHWDIIVDRRWFDDQVCHLLGIDPAKFSGTAGEFLDAVHPDDHDQVRAALVQTIEHRTPHESEYRTIWPDGSIHHIAARGELVYDNAGQPIRLNGLIWDITARRQAEEELERTRDQLAEGQRIAHLGSWEYIAATQTTVWSDEQKRIYGLDPAQPSPDYEVMLRHHIHPDDRAELDRNFREALEHRAVFENENRIIRPDGTVRWIYNKAQPYFDEHGKLLRYIGTTLDITERVRVGAALRESEQRLRSFFESNLLGVIYWNVNGEITDANDKFLEMVGYQRADLTAGRINWRNMTPPEYLHLNEGAIQDLRAIGAHGLPFEKEYIRKDGTLLPIITAGKLLDEARGNGVSFVLDITERKQAEKLVETQRQLLEAVVHNLPNGVVLYRGPEYIFEVANPAYLTIAPGKDILGKTLEEVWPEVYSVIAPRFKRVLETGESFHVTDEKVQIRRSPEGPLETAYFSWSLIRVRLSGEAGWGILNTTVETTERVQAEEALRESEQRLRRFYESGLLGVVYWNMNGEITEANAKFLEMVGYRREDLEAGRIDWIKMTPPEYRHLDEASMKELQATGFNRVPFEKEFIRQDGTRLPIIAAGAMLDEARFNGVAFILDITERKQAEQALWLRTAELEFANSEMEAFAYSVSHDLKAPLRAIQGFSQMLLGEYATQLDEEGLRLFNVIVSNTQTMGNLIDDLLGLSRLGRHQIRKSAIDLAAMARKVFEQFQGQEPERDLQLSVQDLPKAWGDHSLINQVMMNLLGNAIKYTKTKKPAIIEVGQYMQGQENIYYVKDNGIGFDERYADKLFGVFQRLHGGPEYEGTGVGLAIVQRIIRRHGGRVWAEGKVGEGATFYFALPKSEN
jgi:PAS domain S-box-containing protein